MKKSRGFVKEEEQLTDVCPEAVSEEETGGTGRYGNWIY